MEIATFNVNVANKRLPSLLAWLAASRPDVVCLQELKADQDAFPINAITETGYNAVWRGQWTWNGVAILARDAEPCLIRDVLPGDPDDLTEPVYRGCRRWRLDRVSLPAEWQPAARSEIRLQARLVRSIDRPCSGDPAR